MKKHGLTTKVLVTILVLSLQSLFIPVSAEGPSASLSGTVLSSETQAPLQGVKLHVGDPKTGKIYSSAATGEDGGFELSELPGATYELAVESDGGLYLVGTPVTLAPGQSSNVNVAINKEMAKSPQSAAGKKGGTSIWNNPGMAAVIVVGSAFVLGALINEVTKDESTASPSE
jgi:hypothetical protein